jgi:TP901 family phage tail tape measure protein
VAAISGATGKDLEDLRDKAQEMGSKTKFSASEAADAFSYMAMAGWKTGDMLDGIEGVMNLAAASGEDLATTSDIVTDALTAFGLKAEDSGHFADVLAAASSNANTNVGLMGETFKYVAPVAGALGLKADEVAVAIGLMANSGIKASQAGTSLRSILTRMVSPTKQSFEAMKQLGLSVTNADGSMKSMKEITDMLRDKFGKLTEAEKAHYASTLAGKNAMSGLLAIVNASDEDYEKLTAAIDNCDGAAEKMAATMQDNLQGDITIFKSALEGAQIALSDKLTPSLREFVQFGTGAVADLTKAFREDGLDGVLNALENIVTNGIALLMQYLPKFIEVGAAVLKAVVKGIVENMPLIIEGAKEIVNALIEGLVESVPLLNAFGAEGVKAIIGGIVAALTAGKVISTISGFITLFKGIATSITAAGGLIPALSAMISPIGLVVAAIGAAVAVGVLLYKNWDTIKEAASNVVEAIKTAWENIKTLGTNLVNNIKTGITEKAKDLVQGAKDLAGKVSESIKTKWENIKTFGTNLVNNIKTGITEKANDLVQGAKDLAKKVSESIKTAWENVKSFGSNLVSKIKNGIAEKKSELVQAASNLAKKVSEAISNAWEKVKTLGSNFVTNIKNGITNKKKDILTGASELATKVKETISTKWEKAKTIGSNLIAYLTKGASEKTGNLNEMISKVVGNIGDYWKKFSEASKNYGAAILASLANGTASKVQDLYDLYKKIVQNIIDSVKGVIESAKSWGSGLMQSFINGIVEKFNSLGEKLRQVGQMIRDYLHFSQPDKGPLSGPNGFESYAPDMMKSFAKGITDNADYVTNAINRSFDFGDRIKGFGDSTMRGAGQGDVIPRGAAQTVGGTVRNMTTILQLDRYTLARVVYELYNEEQQRVGVKLAGGTI